MSNKIELDATCTYRNSRESKAAFVYGRYRPILQGRIIDIGADQCYLRNHLPPTTEYVPVGRGDHELHVVVDLEKQRIPFGDQSFDCALCLDVLEHLENIHDVFREVCRLSREWVLISLPNPWMALLETLQRGPFSAQESVKFYGLPDEPPADRHKWFFSTTEAERFVQYQAKRNSFQVYDVHRKVGGWSEIAGGGGWLDRYRCRRVVRARQLVFGGLVDRVDLQTWTTWHLLKRLE